MDEGAPPEQDSLVPGFYFALPPRGFALAWPHGYFLLPFAIAHCPRLLRVSDSCGSATVAQQREWEAAKEDRANQVLAVEAERQRQQQAIQERAAARREAAQVSSTAAPRSWTRSDSLSTLASF